MNNHMGAFNPRPIGRNRRRAIAAAALLAVGLASPAYADEPVQQVAPPPSYGYRVALPAVMR
jgi:hypothetical protein